MWLQQKKQLPESSIFIKRFFMAYNIDDLLSLPVKERRKISEKLFSSLPESKTVTEEDKATIKMLDKRWDEIKSGKAKLLTPAQLRAEIKKSRTKKI